MKTPFLAFLPSSKISLSFVIPVLSLGLGMATVVSAQQATVDDAKKQIPTNKAGIENAVETTKEAVSAF